MRDTYRQLSDACFQLIRQSEELIERSKQRQARDAEISSYLRHLYDASDTILLRTRQFGTPSKRGRG